MLPIIIKNKRGEIKVDLLKLFVSVVDLGVNICMGNYKGSGKVAENIKDSFSSIPANEKLAFSLIFKPIYFALDRTMQELIKNGSLESGNLRLINPYFEVEKSIIDELTSKDLVLDYSFFDDDHQEVRFNHPLVLGAKRILNKWLEKNIEADNVTINEFNRQFNTHYIDGFISILSKDQELEQFHSRIEAYLLKEAKYGKSRLAKFNKLIEDKYSKLYYRKVFLNYSEVLLTDIYIAPNYIIRGLDERLKTNVLDYFTKELNKKNKKRIYLVFGHPGEGKSSFSYMLLHENIQSIYERPIFYINCSMLDDSFIREPIEDITRYIEREYHLTGVDNCIWLLDGLDEITDIIANVEKTINKICIQKSIKTTVIITCRNGFIDINSDQIKKKREIEVIYLSPFNEAQQEKMIRGFQEKCQKTTNNEYLLQEVQKEDTIKGQKREIWDNPIMLSLILNYDISFDTTKSSKIAVYEKVFDSLFDEVLKKSETDASHPTFTDITKKDWLPFIENAAFLLDRYPDVFHNRLSELILITSEGNKIVERSIQEKKDIIFFLKASIGLFLKEEEKEDNSAVLRFEHKTIQEYLIAKKIYREIKRLSSISSTNSIILSVFQGLFSHKKQPEIVWDYILELFHQDENHKKVQEVFDKSELLRFYIDHQGLSKYSAGSNLETDFLSEPINKAVNTFYGYWRIITLFLEQVPIVSSGYQLKLMNCIHYVMSTIHNETLSLGRIDWTAIDEINGANFKNVDFSSANLSGIRFSNCDFRNASFESTNLDATIFNNCNLSFVDMTGGAKLQTYSHTEFRNCYMSRWQVDEILFLGVKIIDTRVINSNLTSTNFENITILDSDFIATRFKSVAIVNSRIEKCRFNNSSFSITEFGPGTSFQSSSIIDSIFEDITIKGVDFSFAKIEKSKGLNGKDLVNCASLFKTQLDRKLSAFFEERENFNFLFEEPLLIDKDEQLQNQFQALFEEE